MSKFLVLSCVLKSYNVNTLLKFHFLCSVINSFPLFFWKADFILYCARICARFCYRWPLSSFLISSVHILHCFIFCQIVEWFCFDSCFCTFPYKNPWLIWFSVLPAFYFSFHFSCLQCILHLGFLPFHSNTHKIPFKDILCLALLSF